VVDIGAVTTPMLYYVAATRGQHGCNSGIQVTGSHNPKDYNGFKMVMAAAPSTATTSSACASASRAETYTTASGRSATMDIGANTARASSATASWRGR
jgi:phosphomannomutase